MTPRAHLLRTGRYLGVGGACAGLHNLVMIGGDRLGAPFPPLILVSYALVVVVGYALHARVTFGEPARWAAFGRYAVAMAGSIPTTFALLLGLRTGLRLPMVLASPTATVLMLAVNFLVSRWAIVRPAPAPTGGLP